MKLPRKIVITTSAGLTIVGIINCPLPESTAVQRRLIAAIKRKYGSTGVHIRECQPVREVESVGRVKQ